MNKYIKTSILMFIIVGGISFIQMRASGQFKEVD